jgi:hypothetical protein
MHQKVMLEMSPNQAVSFYLSIYFLPDSVNFAYPSYDPSFFVIEDRT